jgi:hypothetical protein
VNALVVISLFLATLLAARLVAVALRAPAPLRKAAIRVGALAPAVAAMALTAYLLGRAGLLTTDPFQPPADAFGLYRRLLCDLSPTVQGLLGLALLLPAGIVTLHALVRTFPGRAVPAATIATVGFALAYPFLPFHLSAPDFDDVFVVDKFLCAIGPDWHNNKPFFTVYDFLYRVPGLLPGPAEIGRPFAVNGWLYLLFQANLLLVLHRLVPWPRESGRSLPRIAAVLALSNLGGLVLAHTVHYELAGAVFLLTGFHFVASIIEDDLSVPARRSALLAFCALSALMVPLTNKQMSILWMLGLVHGILGLSRAKALRSEPVMPLLLVVLAGLSFVASNELHRQLDLARFQAGFVVLLGAIALAAVLGVRRFFRSGAAGRFFVGLDERDYRRTVSTAYLLTTTLAFVLPNQHQIGLPVALTTHWPLATNHARYSLPLYPFLAAAIGWGLRRLRNRTALALTLAGSLFAAWNFSYLFGFYASSPAFGEGGPAFQRNLRPVMALAAQLEDDGSGPFFYLPIGRDHGDHFLLAAVRPGLIARNLCEASRDALPETGRAIVSRHTLQVSATIREELTGIDDPAPRQPFSRPLPSLALPDWEVVLRDVAGLDRNTLADWCAVEAPIRPGQHNSR